MLDGRVEHQPRAQRRHILRELPARGRRAIHHGDHAIHGHLRADIRPVERLHQRFG